MDIHRCYGHGGILWWYFVWGIMACGFASWTPIRWHSTLSQFSFVNPEACEWMVGNPFHEGKPKSLPSLQRKVRPLKVDGWRINFFLGNLNFWGFPENVWKNMVTHLPRVQAMSGFCGCLPGGQGLPSAWLGWMCFFFFGFWMWSF